MFSFRHDTYHAFTSSRTVLYSKSFQFKIPTNRIAKILVSHEVALSWQRMVSGTSCPPTPNNNHERNLQQGLSLTLNMQVRNLLQFFWRQSSSNRYSLPCRDVMCSSRVFAYQTHSGTHHGTQVPSQDRSQIFLKQAAMEMLSLLAVIIGASVAYATCVAVHRLTLSPVARIPGPRLAALTFWYEFYYDVVLRGQYTWKIMDLHKQYGMYGPDYLYLNRCRTLECLRSILA